MNRFDSIEKSNVAKRLSIGIGIAIVGYLADPLVTGFISFVVSWVRPWISIGVSVFRFTLTAVLIYFYDKKRPIITRQSNPSKIAKRLLISIGIAIIGYSAFPLVIEFISLVISWLSPWVSSAESVFSVVLTASLIYLYSRQSSILSNQSDIQTKQTRLMEAQVNIMEAQANWTEAGQAPWIVIDNWGVLNDNRIYFEIFNLGNSAVENMSVMMHMQPLEWVEEDESMPKLSPEYFPKIPITDIDGQTRIAPSKNDSTKFFADDYVSTFNPDFPNVSEDDIYEKNKFQTALTNVDKEHELIRIWVTLTYEDISGKSETIHLATVDFDLSHITEFKEVFNKGDIVQNKIRDQPMSPHPPE
ncbi:hypothetical protein [Haloprofundus halobius]|uniref:hypothetical protein n=1 Tax=Haloprofundus halobius TaxID=2876194 RepID=UPI001CCC9A41|nr:hypothetical protein [Haloprofundus halobius]